jgi:hypothetical protein
MCACDCSNGKSKETDTTDKQFRWSKLMHTLLLETIVYEATKGNKPSNTFNMCRLH